MSGSQYQRYPLWQPMDRFDPYPLYRILRRENPIYWDEGEQVYFVTAYADVVSVLRSEAFVASLGDDFLKLSADPRANALRDHYDRWMVFSSSGPHAAQRRSFSCKAFGLMTRSALEAADAAATDRIRNIASNCFDLVACLVEPIVLAFTRHIFGVDEEEAQRLRSVSSDLIAVLNSRFDAECMVRASDALDYLRILLSRGTIDGSDQSNVIALLRSEIGSGALNFEDAVASLSQVLTGSIEPVCYAISNSIVALLRNPEQMERLWRQEVEVEAAVTELLRFDTPFQYVPRLATREVELRGRKLSVGRRVLCMIASANHDEKQFERPDTLDFSRMSNRILSFGIGPHTCLGIPGARGLVELTLQKLRGADWSAGIRLVSAKRVPSIGMRGYSEVQVAV